MADKQKAGCLSTIVKSIAAICIVGIVAVVSTNKRERKPDDASEQSKNAPSGSAKPATDSAKATRKPTQGEANAFLGLTEAALIERLGQLAKVETSNSPDGPFKMVEFDRTKGSETFFVIFAADGRVSSGFYRGVATKGGIPKDLQGQAAPFSPPLSSLPFNIATVTEAEMPKQVILKSSEVFPVSGSSGSASVPVGARLDVLGRTGEMLALRFVNGQKQLHHTKTNFADEVTASRVRREQAEQARNEQLAKAKKAQEEAAAAKLAAEEAQLKAEIGRKPVNSAWNGSVREVEAYLKANLKDPKSTEYIEWSPVTLLNLKDGRAWGVRVKYRSKNSFGGYVIEEKIAIIRHGEVVQLVNP